MQQVIEGDTSVIQILTRQQVAAMLKPPVTTRTLQTYIDLACLFLPEFKQFRNPKTGGLSRYCKLTNLHVPILQKIRTTVLFNGHLYTERDLADNPEKYQEAARNEYQTVGVGVEL